MSEHRLPEDVENWPENPYELLGVSRSVDRVELRRAYVRLIRQFKPDHFPEQFRRIRAAYEAAGHWLEWSSAAARQAASSTQTTTIRTSEVRAATDKTSQGQAADLPPTGRSEQEQQRRTQPQKTTKAFDTQTRIASLWKQAIAGQAADAYRGLVELESMQAGDGERCLRLYWLLVLYPKLDDRRDRCEWLVRGIRRHMRVSPLVELYCREIEETPAEASAVRSQALFSAAARSPIVVVLARARWNAMRKLLRWESVLADLAELRKVCSRADPVTWAQLVICAIDQLAFAKDLAARKAFDELLDELDSIPEAEPQIQWAQARFDLLRPMAIELQELQKSFGELGRILDLIPDTWPQVSDETQMRLLHVLGTMLADPQTALASIDQLVTRAASLAAHLAELLHQTTRGAGRLKANEEFLGVVRQFFRMFAGLQYQQIRSSLLQMCIQEQVAPDELWQLPLGAPNERLTEARALIDKARSDVGLILAYRAHEALWS
jgi:hypothetical protein